MGRRKKSLKVAKDNYAFVVDGQTEVWYLEMLKRNEKALQVDIIPRLPSSNKKSLSDQFTLVKQFAENYTKVFWIVDYDVITKETIEQKGGAESPGQKFIRLRAKSLQYSNVEVIVNNPCLEFWFYLHFNKSAKLFGKCISVEKELSKKYLLGYTKSRKFFTKEGQDIYIKLKKYLNTAVKNAASLNKFDAYNTDQAFCEMDIFFSQNKLKEILF